MTSAPGFRGLNRGLTATAWNIKYITSSQNSSYSGNTGEGEVGLCRESGTMHNVTGGSVDGEGLLWFTCSLLLVNADLKGLNFFLVFGTEYAEKLLHTKSDDVSVNCITCVASITHVNANSSSKAFATFEVLFTHLSHHLQKRPSINPWAPPFFSNTTTLILILSGLI